MYVWIRSDILKSQTFSTGAGGSRPGQLGSIASSALHQLCDLVESLNLQKKDDDTYLYFTERSQGIFG